MTLKVGATAPDFTLPAQNGEMVRLYDFLGKKPVALFFYPKDDTPICTKEACAFRDTHNAFTTAGAEVLGVSGDNVESHRLFAQKHSLPYRILSDETNAVRRLYDVEATFGIFPGRVTFVIDGTGIIKHVFSSQLSGARHASSALEAVFNLTHPPKGKETV